MPLPLGALGALGAIGSFGSAASTASSFAAEGASNAAAVQNNMQAIKNAADNVQNVRTHSAIQLMNSAGENAKSIRL